jgi:flagellar hook-basal body complex protein FliE
MIRNGFLFAIALLLAGCAGLRAPRLPYGDPEERQAIQLIDYAQRVATMTAEEQRRELSAGDQVFARDKDAISRMRLALLLATPGAGVHDAARAASLLEPMATPGEAASPLRSFARLLHAQLNERASEQKRSNQMREQLEARKDAERTVREQLDARKDAERNLREQIEARKETERTLREQLEALKEAERTMREQLEALKEVERTIMQRGQESQPRRR